MTEEEQRAFEQRAPTTLPHKRGATSYSWDEELLLAAEEGDIPRMACALDNGAHPKALKNDCSVAFLYAYGKYDDANDRRCHFASSGIDQNQAWAWLKARGFNLHASTPRTFSPNPRSVWELLYTESPLLTDHVDAKCAEVNLWALWKNASSADRHSILANIDERLCLEVTSPGTDAIQTLKGLPSLSSRLMKEITNFEGITRSVCGKPLSVFALQSRVLALSSLLGARQGLPLETRHGCSQDYMKLGLWAYAPDSVFQGLLSLPFYRPVLLDCLTRAVYTLHRFYDAPQETLDPAAPHAALLARRLARGTQTLIRHGVEFPRKTLKALLIVPEMRPFIEKVLLKATLDEKGSETHAQTSSRSRVRL